MEEVNENIETIELEELNEELIIASRNGSYNEVKKLLDKGADFGYQDAQGVTPLMRAAEGGYAEVVSLLLEHGAPWNSQDEDGYCAGEYAIGNKHDDVLDIILEHAVRCELILGALTRRLSASQPAQPTSDYLNQKLIYRDNQLIDADGEAVMMGWETPLMLKHAELICRNGGVIMNVGFGLGIIDTAIQSYPNITQHVIIEAHPDVYEHMVQNGWKEKPNVRIMFGRWQEMIPILEQEGVKFDGIFFDTYGEYYEEMREFHQHVPGLLRKKSEEEGGQKNEEENKETKGDEVAKNDSNGVYSFFNGLASDNIFFHMVYCRLIQLELARWGVQTSYERVDVEALGDDVWAGVRNKYWHFETYFLPTCVLGSEEDDNEEGEGEEGGEEEEEKEKKEKEEKEA
eukprot:CAMPEP_0175056876 /NCGR_PEP_ID=MMETSP0052_2-20121109/10933_1 /TAXON_ID=51329 ORGANISM="Polytomella parva, Strain SAG 63-3" /NCGR_SAMPLE_ID=MMETSP0052_2 /ASSEMBLY_ACC=CAM_ASM_000194 /LENGTH=400 /DNA_ID=CAMNT_0016321989 /DNA_START=47 /DNA_END=1249 /DNA_ORIENTATION=+